MDSNSSCEPVSEGSRPTTETSAEKVNHFYDYLKIIRNVCGMYFVWILLHYLSAHLYIYFCVPATIAGFLLAPFMVPAPHCQALRWAVYNGGNVIIAMWVLIGASFMKWLTV